MAAIGRTLVWYLLSLGTLSPCWRSLLATIENVTRSRKDIQFSSEKLMIIFLPLKVKKPLFGPTI